VNTLLHRATRVAALATATALAATTAALVGAAPASAVTPAGDASNWLSGELTNGLIHNPNFGGFDDYGLTIDTAFAIQAVGGNDGVVRQIRDAMADRIDNYTTDVDFGDPADVYSGASAKALVLAQATGADPRSYGGIDLVAQTEGRVSETAPIAGRLEDFGDYANVFGQVFAARGLTVAGSPKASSVTSFLLKQQCTSGFFRQKLTVDKTAAQQGCVEGESTSSPDIDVTALAVLQLSAIPQKDASVTTAIGKAAAWLKSAQRADGSFGAGSDIQTSNSNSTGLAGWALASQGECVAAGRAGAWVQKLQVRNPAAGSPMAGESGAIAYDAANLASGLSSGIASDSESEDRWRRATTQAAPALAAALTSANVTFAGPTDFQRAGTQPTLTVTGAAEGERVCLSGPGVAGVRGLTAAGGNTPITTTVLLPGTTATPVYTITTATGTRSLSVKVLGKTKLDVRAKKKKVEKGDRQTIKVKGLESGERVVVRIRDKKVATGLAKADGTFKTKVKIKNRLARPGRPKVVVTGEFKDLRKGTAYFRVRR
jgi:hypothetical protein